MKTISTSILADKANTTHWDLIRVMHALAEDGEMDPAIIPRKADGTVNFERPVRLGLADVVAIAVHMRLPRTSTDEIARIFTRAESARPPMLKKYVDHGSIADVLGAQEFVEAVKALRDGTGGTPQIARDFGIRLVHGMLWIGTSTPYISEASQRAKLIQGKLGLMLASVPGATRQGTKKFAGVGSKVVAVPVDELLRLIDTEGDIA